MELLLVIGLFASTPDSIAQLYATGDVDRLISTCSITDDRFDELTCRYRLFALTADEAYLQDLDTGLQHDTARELAVLSGLWGLRAATSAFPGKIRNGLRASRLLNRAIAADPDDPFVLLVQGQSYLFRPKSFGGDFTSGLETFRRLRSIWSSDPVMGITSIEIDVWIWYALHRLGDPTSEEMKQGLLRLDPPSMFRRFLLGPP